jgi:hypothetical protein
MSNPYVGEIRMFGGNFAPAGWAFCQGQLMPISENETLFNLIGRRMAVMDKRLLRFLTFKVGFQCTWGAILNREKREESRVLR